jgi:hypothetical protein
MIDRIRTAVESLRFGVRFARIGFLSQNDPRAGADLSILRFSSPTNQEQSWPSM